MKNPVRNVSFGNGMNGSVSLNSPVFRYPKNPILTADLVNEIWNEPRWQVVTVHNAGVAKSNNETVMLFRSHLRTGKSILGVARSYSGVNGWRICNKPLFVPASANDRFGPGVESQKQIEIEAGGVEDPRIIHIENRFVITYSSYYADESDRVRVCLATTRDFKEFIRYGPMIDVDMRNVVIFPEKFKNGLYAALFRPNDVTSGEVGGSYTQICLGYAHNWRRGWEISGLPIMKTGAGPAAFSGKIGPGAPPIKTWGGWLDIFHGVRKTMGGNPYVLGVALHDLENPVQVKMSSIPILFPTNADCKLPDSKYVHVPQVVFCCGAVKRHDGSILIYYGGNDTVMNVAITHEDILIELCLNYGQNPITGELLYPLNL